MTSAQADKHVSRQAYKHANKRAHKDTIHLYIYYLFIVNKIQLK